MRWKEPKKIPDDVNVELKDFHPIVRKLLYVRGIDQAAQAEKFLDPQLDDLADPFEFYEMEKACEKIEKTIKENKRIFIHGDFDADGICATAILWEYLYREMGARVLPYIPSRVDEGYGMSESSLNSILDKNGDLVITVDCGIRDRELVDKYRRRSGEEDGLDFIITDHHELGEKLPSYVPILHPDHPKGNYPFRYISGAAVAWKLVAALEKRRKGRLIWEEVPGLDLAAMSTVCDIMPLVNENRVMVKYGLEKMRHDPRLGLKYMLQEASIKKQDLQTYHLGYILGPRLNAAGRIGDATDALRLLVTQKDRRAGTLAQLLGRLNKKRQDMTSDLLREVRSAIESEGTGKHLYFAYGDDWPEGIIGLVAGKIQDEFNHPVVLVSKSKKKSICRGSARSISGFSIIDAIEEFDDLLESFGGHDQAAGFSVAPEKIDDFKEKLQELAREKLEETNFVKEISADAKVDVSEMNWQYWQASKPLAPFGYSNRKPIFWISNAVIGSLKTVGDGKHLKLVLKGDGSGFLQCIYFGGGENIEKLAQGDIIDVIGSLGVNNWNGEQNLQFNIKDLHHNA